MSPSTTATTHETTSPADDAPPTAGDGAPPNPDAVRVDSEVLGSVTVLRKDLITFPAGLFGFPECRRFTLLPAEREGFFWLQSMDYGALAFLMVDPFTAFDDYAVELDTVNVAELAPADPADIALLAIVTLPRSAEEPCTANLQGPVAINMEARTGKQIVLPDSPWGVRCPLEVEEA